MLMKALISILFSCLFLLTTMQQTAFLLLYKINEKAITEKYCVNKKVKNSCCKGKCHLNKTIAKAEENNKNPFSNSNIKIKDSEVFCQQLQKVIEPTIIPGSLPVSHYIFPLPEEVTGTLIKPPAVLG